MRSHGIVFPKDGGKQSTRSSPTSRKATSVEKRSTTATSKRIVRAALSAAGDDMSVKAIDKLSSKAWRFNYAQFFVSICAHMARGDNANMLKIARAGLQAAHELFTFHRVRSSDGTSDGQEEIPLREAIRKGCFMGTFKTCVSGGGSGTDSGAESVPYRHQRISVPYKGKEHWGKNLANIVSQWAEEGQCEPSFAASIKEVLQKENDGHENFFDLHDMVFVLIGATSEMGPTDFLLEHGATVVALARPASQRDPRKWERLIARSNCSPGTLIYPCNIRAGTENDVPGADAISETPEIINWLTELFTSHPLAKGKTPHIYSGIYLDGGNFVRASVAMEAIISELTLRLDPAQNPALIYIDTPTSAHAIHRETFNAQSTRKSQASCFLSLGAMLGIFKPSSIRRLSETSPFVIGNFLAIEQGPNYAVAKLLQKFRAVWSRHSNEYLFSRHKSNTQIAMQRPKQLVSITTGPAAKTDSVMHSKTMALVMNKLEGECPPNVAHEPLTVQSLMPLIMIRDLRSQHALGNPLGDKDNDDVGSVEGMAFVVENAWHGGVWRSPFNLKYVGASIFVKHYGQRYLVPVFLLLMIGIWFMQSSLLLY